MRAARYDTSGPDAWQLRLVDLERPHPAAGEVLVRLRVAGVNPTDWRARRPGGVPAAAPQVVPGQDGAGVIESAGAGVDPARVGQRVWLYNAQWRRAQGTAAQWIALPSEQAVELPEAASFDLGAGLGIPAMTAHRCLFADGDLAGARVLVHGGAGAVGHAAIELARWGGAHVAATVSSEEKGRLAAAAGAELVVNYRNEDVAGAVRAWAPDGVQRIVEVDFAANVETDAAVLADQGVISVYGITQVAFAPPRMLMAHNALLRFVLVYTIPEAARLQAVADISTALRQGALTALPAVRFPLSEIAAAHDAVERGTMGKVLVEVG